MSKITEANAIVTEASKFLGDFLALAGVAVPQIGIAVNAVRAFIRWLHRDKNPDAPPLTPEQEQAILAACADMSVQQHAVNAEFIERLKAQAGLTGGTLEDDFTTATGQDTGEGPKA